MFTKRFFSILGLFIFFAASFGNLGLWVFFNKTQEVPYLKEAVGPGDIIQPNNIRFRSIRTQDLPEESTLSKVELSSPKWRAVTGITPTDPLTKSKVTDKTPLKIEPNQVFMSFPFNNTGLISFLEPGDKISIIGPKVIDNILVLGKYDKNGTKIALLSSLTSEQQKQAQGVIDQTLNQQNTQQQPQSAASLLLLVTVDQGKDIQSMPGALIALKSRDLLIPTQKPTTDEKISSQNQTQGKPNSQASSQTPTNQNGGEVK